MVKKCPVCGEINSDEAVVCLNCGERIEGPKKPQSSLKYKYQPKKNHVEKIKFNKKKNSHWKLFAVILILILAVAAILLIFVFPIQSFQSDSDRFIGSWEGEREYYEGGYHLTFYDNGTFKWRHRSFSKSGPFTVNEVSGGEFVDGELFFKWKNSYGNQKTNSFTYYFTDDGEKLHLFEKDSLEGYIFTKE